MDIKSLLKQNGVPDDILDIITSLICEIIGDNIRDERTFTINGNCPFCMINNKFKAVAGIHGEFKSRCKCKCGRKLIFSGIIRGSITKIEEVTR